ncbi:P2-RdRp [Torilis crimson leaf virus]|uniref:P2-RdRp n=3 Tax=Polerovirus TaxID=119164 RepID=A0A6H2MW31_9VIRU|nr:P2-RdRp [Torilis crimson leaf virus]
MSNLAFLKLFLVLCFSLSLSSSTTTTIWETDTFGFNRITSVNLSYGDLFAATTPGLIKGEGEVIAPPLLRASNAELTSQPYTTLTGAILKKICLDARNVSSKVLKASRECLEVFSVSGTAMLQTATESFLWMLVAIWWTAYLWAAKFIWILVTYFTIPVLALGTLTLITMVIYRAARWICSQLPMHFILFPLTIIKFIIGMRVRAKKTPIVKEKACEGYTTFSIPQTPPKNSVVEVIFKDGSHAGYATCVKLHNGHNGLLTAHHVCQDNDMAIHSLRNGAKIKLEQFKIFFSNSDLDVTIYMGPRSWESTLACSAVDMVCANRLAVCETRLFGFENNEWRSRNGKLLGTFEKKVSVLSNTVEGDSGSAYFHGKNVVGVHTGYPVTGENFNLMAPIPSIPGLTSSKLVFETTAPQGKIFDDELINYFNELCEEFSISEARSIMKNKKMINYEASVKKQNQGNRETQHRLRNKRRSKHPRDKERDYYTASCNGSPIFSTFRAGLEPQPGRHDGQNLGSSFKPNESGGHRNENRGEGVQPANEEQEQIPREARWKRDARGFEENFRSIYNWQVPATPLQIPGFREVGATPQYYYAKQKQEGKWGRKLTEQYPELAASTRGFGWPQFGPKAELRSLQLQASRWLERAQTAKTPSDAKREHVIQRTVSAYAAATTPTPSFCVSDKITWPEFLENFKLAVVSLELSAGVGVPFISYGKRTHRDWIENPTLLPVLARMTFDRLQKISEANFENMTPEELVQNGLCDPIRLFVKGEPHKQSKLDEGRYRLIMSVSLLDQLVARVLFQSQNKLEIALWRAVPSKPGFGLSTDDQTENFVDCLAKQVGETADEVIKNWPQYLIPTDCSGFDWSVSDWLLEDDMEVRNRLTHNCTPLLRRLRAGWLKCISNSVLCLSDGTLLAQTKPGVQKSGSYNTSSSNSRIRVMAAFHSGASWAMAMGDDALESVDTDLSVYKDLGFKVEVSAQLEFCSHIFKERNLAIPVNVNKMLYKLIYGYDPECGNAEVLSNYLSAVVSVMNELRHDPDLVSKLFLWLVPSAATK